MSRMASSHIGGGINEVRRVAGAVWLVACGAYMVWRRESLYKRAKMSRNIIISINISREN